MVPLQAMVPLQIMIRLGINMIALHPRRHRVPLNSPRDQQLGTGGRVSHDKPQFRLTI